MRVFRKEIIKPRFKYIIQLDEVEARKLYAYLRQSTAVLNRDSHIVPEQRSLALSVFNELRKSLGIKVENFYEV